MAIVEHINSFPSFVWAAGYKAELRRDYIEVHGIQIVSDDDLCDARDLFRGYREAVSRYGPQKRQGKRSPHIQFANAQTDQELFSFVQRFGPVVIRALRLEDRNTGSEDEFGRTWIYGEQDIHELRVERDVYRAALELLSELRSQSAASRMKMSGLLDIIGSGVSTWPTQWLREKQLRKDTVFGEPSWSFTPESVEYIQLLKFYAEKKEPFWTLLGPDAVRAGHLVLCELVNSFAPSVYVWGDMPVEGPHWDLVGGVRPLLYYILRREYLLGGSIGICRNTDCRKVFEIERGGQGFCSEECSRRQRQREYWKKRGNQLRRKRVRAQKKLHGNENKSTNRVTAESKERKR